MPGNTHKWSLRETIRQYEKTQKNSRDYFMSNNKVIIFGKAETNLERHHKVEHEVFYCVTLEVVRTDGQVDHIPVLISSTIMQKKNLNNPFKGSFIEVAGQYRSYDLINDGARQVCLFVLAKNVSLFTKQARIQKRMGKNVIFLDGCVADYPIIHFANDNMEVTELVLEVPRNFAKFYYIPCIMYGKYAELATTLRAGDYMAFYGQIQNRQRSIYNNAFICMCDYCTTHQVLVTDIQTSPMFRRATN